MNFFNGFTGSEDEAYKLWILLSENPEPTICKTFGCGRVLTDREKLFGDKCIACNGRAVIIGPGRCRFSILKIINARKIVYGKS